MKKILAIFAVIALLSSIAIGVSAAEFVPSVSYVPYPGLVVIDEDSEGNKIVGYVTDSSGNVLSTEYHGCILITPVLDAQKGISGLSDAAEKLLVDTYESLTAENVKLSELHPELNDIAKKAFGENATAENLVIRELIDITAVCEDLIKYLEQDGNTITLTFKMVAPQEDFLTVMTLNDGKWEEVEEVKNNTNGTLGVKFDRFCPVLFLTGFPAEDVVTDHNVGLYWLIALCAIILLLAVAVYFLLRRKH